VALTHGTGVPTRIPLLTGPENRDHTDAKDAKLINAFVEQVSKDRFRIVKRPGMQASGTTAAGTGLGIFNWNGDIYAVVGSVLYKNGVSLQTGLNTSAQYTFSISRGANPSLLLNNGAAIYVYTPTGSPTWTAVAIATTVALTGNITTGSAEVTGLSSTASLSVGMSVTSSVGSDLPLNTAILTIDSSTKVTLTNKALLTHTGASLTFSSTGLPAGYVKGSAYLDGTTYILTADSAVYGSNINDPTTWDPINYLLAQIEADTGIRCEKQLVYVIAMKSKSVEIFYDAGNTSGSPLGAVQGAKVSVGCRHADSVQSLDGVLVWIATSENGSVSVMALENLTISPISNDYIDRLLETADYTTVYSWITRYNGHVFYGVTLKNSNRTLVCDLTTRQWAEWQDPSGNYFPYVSCTLGTANVPIFLHESSGETHILNSDVYQDNGVTFDVTIITPNFDGGVRVRKTLPIMDLLTDQVTNSTLSVSYTEDDYQTWSTARSMDLSQARPFLENCGTFRRRAWKLVHSANTPFRATDLEASLLLGTL